MQQVCFYHQFGFVSARRACTGPPATSRWCASRWNANETLIQIIELGGDASGSPIPSRFESGKDRG
jgi:hypothetical protein